MTKHLILLTLVGLTLVSRTSNGYELATHSRITQHAYQQSILSNPDTLRNLGIAANSSPFGEVYYDITWVRIKERLQQYFDRLSMPDKGKDYLTVKGWLMRGAIREDDLLYPPGDDPYGNFVRVLNHFFDPLNKRGLTVGGVPVGLQSAPNWAMGSTDIFTQPNLIRHKRGGAITLVSLMRGKRCIGRSRAVIA